MAFHIKSFIVATSLIPGLLGCASASAPSPSPKAAAIESPAATALPAITAVPSPDTKALETYDPVTLIGGQGQVDERFFRPSLSVGDDAALSLPDILPNGAEVSYIVVDLDRGTTVAERNADRDHIPASSAKLATAVVALELLGPEHRFRTELRATGPIVNGVLKGDLILKGGGDPLLDIPDLLPMIDELARQPLRKIEGRFLIDDSLLPRLTEIEPSQPTEAAYNPGLGALSIAFNRVNLRWRNRDGLTVETVPHLDEASFEGVAPDLLPSGGVQLKTLDGNEAVWQLADRGTRRSKRSLPVKDPGLHAGRVFVDLAGLYGIDLPAPKRMTGDIESRLLAVHESRPLAEQVRDMLWYSNNLVAELIGLAAAKTLEPELSSLETSAGLVLSELERRLPDVSWKNARLANHSGLSSKARLTPEQLSAILRHGWNDGMLSGLLSGSGWSGTLARRFDDSDQALRIWAKTGSINYVTALGGYLLSSEHGPAAFVIMISDENARAAYDAEPRHSRKSEQIARVWKDDAEDAMHEIVERWLKPAGVRPSSSLYAQSQANDAGGH